MFYVYQRVAAENSILIEREAVVVEPVALKAFIMPRNLSNTPGLMRYFPRNQLRFSVFKSSQKVLPLPGAEERPTVPPIRSAAFFTIARPMPVPSYFLLKR